MIRRMRKTKPVLIIQGGAGKRRSPDLHKKKRYSSLEYILRSAYSVLQEGGSAVEAVTVASVLFEDDPLFNAGLGSKLQGDGKIRMSASLMDGERLRFSGVVNVEGLKNPVKLALALQRADSRVLAGYGAKDFARKSGLSFRSPYTPEKIAEYRKALEGKTGTVGAVALDSLGRIAAATSTGGRGMELPGRVSDSPTIAGNYASRFAGISATGIGEEIVDFALCAKIATRVQDGLPLKEAFQKSFREARRHKFSFGAVGLARDGSYAALTTAGAMAWAVKNAREEKIFP